MNIWNCLTQYSCKFAKLRNEKNVDEKLNKAIGRMKLLIDGYFASENGAFAAQLLQPKRNWGAD